MKTSHRLIFATSAIICLSSCASANHETITTEKKKGITVVHHRRRVSNGTVDRIEAIDAKGIVTSAEVHVFDVGRLPDGNGGVHEAHRFYQIVQDAHPDLNLPRKVSSGPRSVWTPPNSMPMPADQRINDAVMEVKESKAKLDDAKDKIEKKLAEDNNLRGELETQISEKQRLQDQINAGFNTPNHKPTQPTEAEKVANDQLANWGNNHE